MQAIAGGLRVVNPEADSSDGSRRGIQQAESQQQDHHRVVSTALVSAGQPGDMPHCQQNRGNHQRRACQSGGSPVSLEAKQIGKHQAHEPGIFP